MLAWPGKYLTGLFVVASLCFLWPIVGFSYDQDVATWKKVKRSRTPMSGSRMVWWNASNRSEHAWKVFKEGHRVKAVLTKDDKQSDQRPPFTPRAEELEYVRAYFNVDDGWLIGFNHGEFGAALYWFDRTGQSHYKISDHQIVAFFPVSDGVMAIEGLAHLDYSYGSIIRIAKGAQWQAEKLTLLPEAPYAGTQFQDGRLLLVLSGSLGEYFRNGIQERLKVIEKDGDWAGLYPNSVVLTDDETKAYIGMRQFVAEFDFTFRTLRFLIPDESFLNKLSDKEGRAIRRAYGPP